MGEGALRFTLIGLAFLIVAIVITVEWARYEGQIAADANAMYEPSPVLRQARADAADKLHHYGLDSQTGKFRIPIDRAMTIVANEHREMSAGAQEN